MTLKRQISISYGSDQSPNKDLLNQYAEWMAIFRNSSMESVKKHCRYLTLFLDYLNLKHSQMNFKDLSHDLVETFYLEYCDNHGGASREQMRSILRVFLRFCFAERYVQRDLSIAVPTVRTYRLANIPHSIAEDDVQQMMAHVDRRSRSGRRDYAIMQLLYTYGVRSKQIRVLRLSDINWRKNEINFPPMKYGKAISQPLTSSVGETILDYLQHGRPTTHFSEVFLTVQPPHRPLGHASTICNITSRYASAAGIKSQKVSPHAFRHAFAKRMIQQGNSLKSIADMLGHSQLQTTFIYSKVDFQNLNQVALEWPEDIP
jgi:site-specific recombinase XerD